MAELRYGVLVVLVMVFGAGAQAGKTPPKAPEGFANIACADSIAGF